MSERIGHAAHAALTVCAVAVTVLSAYAAEPAPAKAPPASGKIEFSDRSDRVLIPKAARQSENYEGPVRSGGSGSEPQGPGFTPPQNQGPVFDARKVQDLLDREKNWIFNKPEDFGKEPTVEEILGVEEVGKAPKEEYANRFERFIKEGHEQTGKTGQERTREDRSGAEDEDLANAEDFENGGLGNDVSLRYLLDQQKRDNTGAVESAGDKRDRTLLANPTQRLNQQSLVKNPNDLAQGDALRLKQSIDVGKLLNDPTKGTADSLGAKNGFRQSYTPTFAGGAAKDMDSLLESTRETMSAPAGTRPGGLEAIRGTVGFNAAPRTIAPAPATETYKRAEYKPGVLPIPRRNTF